MGAPLGFHHRERITPGVAQARHTLLTESAPPPAPRQALQAQCPLGMLGNTPRHDETRNCARKRL
jgi:hypothetical protein